MKKWMVVCAIVCSLTVQGCVFVFAPRGPFEPHRGPGEELEMREWELGQRAEGLDRWEQELIERQAMLEDEDEEDDNAY